MRRGIGFAIAGFCLALGAGRAAVAATDHGCDRQCLIDVGEVYLKALAAHDPSAAPISPDARYTENGVTLKPGDGLWATIEGLGDYRLTFVDPDTQEAGAFATVKESGRQVILAVRLHIQSATRISQIESLVARTPLRPDMPAPAMTANPAFSQSVTPAQSRSRAEMAAIADSYFEGLEHATDALTPFDPDCQRIENGMITANNPQAPPGMSRMSCGAQFATGFSPFITAVRDRRYPIMDQDKGLAFAIVFFDHAGTIKDVKMSDGTNLHVPPPFDAPYAFEIFELFKIRDGKIIRVEAVLNTVPYGMKAGW